MHNFLKKLVQKLSKVKLIYQDRMKSISGEVKLFTIKNIFFLNAVILILSIYETPSYSKGKIYGQSKTLSKELNMKIVDLETEINMKMV